MSRPNLFGMGRDDLAALAGELGVPAFRARQIFGWLYERRVREIRTPVRRAHHISTLPIFAY